MINFVDYGTDEATLKSISVDSCSEELIKAMNKQGLVQKDVTVQGKNGKVFTRKQWVKASDVKTSKVSGSSTSKDNGGGSEAKQKAVHQLNNCDVGDILGSVDHMISVGRRKNPNNGDWEMTYTLRSTGKDLSYDEAVKVLTEHFNKTSSAAQSSGQTKSDKRKSMANSASQYNGRTITSIPAGITPMGHGNETYYFEVHLPKGQKGAKKYFKTEKEAKAYIDSQNAPQSVKSDVQKTLDPAYFESIKSDKAEALKYLKDCGITWTENSHAGINWMRAMAAYKKATNGQQNSTQSTAQTAQSAQNSQPSSSSKMSKEDAKKMTQSFTSKVGKTEAERKAFMDKVKAQGITWKDKADNGSDVASAVNWMRCCMAMNKHFAEGGSFDYSVDTVNVKKKNKKKM